MNLQRVLSRLKSAIDQPVRRRSGPLSCAHLVVRALEELVEQPELVHHLERRGVHGVAAEVAQEVAVLFEHRHVDPGAGKEEAGHHPGGAAAGDAACGGVRRCHAARLAQTGESSCRSDRTLALGRNGAGARTGHLEDGRERQRRADEVRRAAARARARHDADRHRRDVCRWRLGRGGRRGHRRPARRGVSRQQGLAGNASRQGTIAACERSLKRLRTDRLDLYLLHWPSRHPIAETVRRSRRSRPTARSGTGACPISTSARWRRCSTVGGQARRRQPGALQSHAPRHRVRPAALAETHGIPIMAYSPVEQGRLAEHRALENGSPRRAASTPAQIALAFTPAPRRRDFDPQGGDPSPCPRQPRGRGHRPHA